MFSKELGDCGARRKTWLLASMFGVMEVAIVIVIARRDEPNASPTRFGRSAHHAER